MAKNNMHKGDSSREMFEWATLTWERIENLADVFCSKVCKGECGIGDRRRRGGFFFINESWLEVQRNLKKSFSCYTNIKNRRLQNPTEIIVSAFSTFSEIVENVDSELTPCQECMEEESFWKIAKNPPVSIPCYKFWSDEDMLIIDVAKEKALLLLDTKYIDLPKMINQDVNEIIDKFTAGQAILRKIADIIIAEKVTDNIPRSIKYYEGLVENKQIKRDETYTNEIQAIGINPKRNIFRLEGEYWTIVYLNKTIRLKDNKGMKCIAFLVQHPNQDFTSIDLYQKYLIHKARPPRHETKHIDHNQLEEISTRFTGPEFEKNELLDNEALSEFRDRLSWLNRENEGAKKNNDEAKMEAIQKEINGIRNILSKALKKNKKSRVFRNDSEKARSGITMAIKRARDKLKESHPQLFKHLKESIKTGSTCSYKPKEEIEWNIH